MRTKSALVVGTGSIAKKYCMIFESLGMECYFVTQSGRRLEKCAEFSSQSRIRKKERKFDLLVVASTTSKHIQHANEYGDWANRILIEKPLAHRLPNEQDLRSLMKHEEKIFISYPIRFAPSFSSVSKIINIQGDSLRATVIAKSNFRNWRTVDVNPDGYWFKNEEGGVLREFSHELDYATMLFGFPIRHSPQDVSHSARNSDFLLTQVNMEFITEQCRSLNFELSIDSESEARSLQVVWQDGMLDWNLLTGLVFYRKSGTDTYFNYGEFNQLQCMKLQVLSVLSRKNLDVTCSLTHALNVIRLIESVQSGLRGELERRPTQ